VRLRSPALTNTARTLPRAAKLSVRAMTQSVRCRPCSATLAALASSISLGMLTWAGHSRAHILQLTHRSATSRTSSELRRRGSRLQQVAQQVGLGPRRRRLGLCGAEDRAHPLAGRLRPALTAAVTLHDLEPDLARLPAQGRRGLRLPGLRRLRALAHGLPVAD